MSAQTEHMDWRNEDLDQVALDAARRVTPEGDVRLRAQMQVAIHSAIKSELERARLEANPPALAVVDEAIFLLKAQFGPTSQGCVRLTKARDSLSKVMQAAKATLNEPLEHDRLYAAVAAAEGSAP